MDFRAVAVRPTYYGRMETKAAAMAWVDEVHICPNPFPACLRISIILMRAPSHDTLQVLQNLDVWDEKVGFVSLGKFAPAGAVLLWPQMRFSQVPSMLCKS